MNSLQTELLYRRTIKKTIKKTIEKTVEKTVKIGDRVIQSRSSLLLLKTPRSRDPLVSLNRTLLSALSALAVLLLAAPSVAQPPVAETQAVATISVDEVERGQRGYGISVFEGSELQRFDVEVVGVLRNFNPGHSFILARLSGAGLESSGVIAGMSGSPVFLDDRLAGAVSFSWDFSTGALAGIMPIAAMSRLGEIESVPRTADGASGTAASTVDSGAGSPRSVPPGLEYSTLLGSLLERRNGRQRLEEALEALAPSTAAGLPSDATTARSLIHFGASGLGPRSLGFAQKALGAVAPAGRAGDQLDLPELEPGSAVAAVLVGGDLQMSASGTVTERRGEQILAFGHPFLGTGAVRLPMAKAEVVAVVASRLSSFKLTNVGEVVGAFDEDRFAGIRGQVGLEAPTTPMKVRISGQSEASFDLTLADLPAMRPSMAAISVLQALEVAEFASGDSAVDMTARLAVDGYDPLEVTQSFDGSGAGFDAVIYLLQLVAFLELNGLVDVDMESIDVDLELHPRPRTRSLVAAHPQRSRVRPGETLQLHLELRDYRGETTRETLDVVIPEQLDKGPFYLFVGDGVSVDAAELQMQPSRPRDFEAALDQLRGYASKRELAVLGVKPARGLLVDGRTLSDLPGSLRSLLSKETGGRVPAVNLAVVERTRIERERPVDGLVRIDLTVEREPHG